VLHRSTRLTPHRHAFFAPHHFRCAANAYYLSVHPKNLSGLIALFDSPKSVEDRMRKLAPIALLAASCACAGTALAFDNGQYENVPADIRAWFKGVTAPNGVPCCDISDGHRTEYDFRAGAYWVPIEGQWMEVPAHAIIRDRGNPVGEAVVWYVHHRGGIVISCFVPADAV
jgi:hypothetical protein